MRVAAVQMNTGADKEANLRAAEDLIGRAADLGASVIALPEYFNYLGPAQGHAANAEPIPGPTIERLSALARRRGVTIHCGSIAERSPETPKLFNTTVVLDPAGEIVARYRKIHLFDIEIAGQVTAMESATIEAGHEVVNLSIDGVGCGLTICYDLRFPELYRILALKGAQVLFIPAAFTMFTGKDHWEVLIRARAIENQCFVVAPAQVGKHPPDRTCYGRSLIVDPWGLVLASAPDVPTVVSADLDMEQLARIRRELPSLQNRRPSAYHWPDAVHAGASR
ncbi:MAG: carbon-nitrogen hydrolase family protein [Chloroflexi bacterium]|nr:carbon-nitrogen hydrolase family protein [Chloroflexota bacterium]